MQSGADVEQFLDELAVALIPLAWQRDALCTEPAYTRVEFFPAKGASTAAARALCARCLVRDDCLAFALEANIVEGVWGGLSGRERRAARSRAA